MPTNNLNPIHDAVAKMSKEDLERFAVKIHDILFLEIDGNDATVNPDKEWDSELINMVAEVVYAHDLGPDETYSLADPTSAQAT